ncbi:hypothetical protein B0H12DRAFT_1231044 [Mycena haematopus]|nr:hypothetical protein B0H12DRAFT_1231044 [Mycena haematopus]
MSEAEPNVQVMPTPFCFARQLTCIILSHMLCCPISPFVVNAQLLLTFLVTVLKHPQTLDTMERSPTSPFALSAQPLLPRDGAQASADARRDGLFTELEDWCLRGMEWVGRKVYQHGFWKAGEEKRTEIEVLDAPEAVEIIEGHMEDDEEEEHGEGAHKAGDGPGGGGRLYRKSEDDTVNVKAKDLKLVGHAHDRRTHLALLCPFIIPGYTILVIDANTLLSSLLMFASVVESFQWTVVISLSVVMELDGLPTHHTSGFCREETEHSMDDLIREVAIWQDEYEHWVDFNMLYLLAYTKPSMFSITTYEKP